MQATQTLLTLSALAGAIHVLAPDHWLPASVLAWQKGWSRRKTAAFAAAIFAFHVTLGFAVFLAIQAVAWRYFDWDAMNLAPKPLVALTWALVVGITFLRATRFGRNWEVFRSGNRGIWGLVTVVSTLGPCESIIPVFMKSGHLGMGYALPFAVFLGGTLVSGTICILVGRVRWNQPLTLPRIADWARRRRASLPIAAGVAMGLAILLVLPK